MEIGTIQDVVNIMYVLLIACLSRQAINFSEIKTQNNFFMKVSNTIFLILMLICVTNCDVDKKSPSAIEKQTSLDIDSEINSLVSVEKKEKFLININYKDQDVRNPDRAYEILKKNNYDKNSYEYQKYLGRMIYVDSLNFVKVKKYLEVYGYPTFKSDNHRVGSAIRSVCMHQPTYQKQLELFPYIYKAYKDSLITADNFSFLLNNMHRHKFGDSYPHAISNEENIKQLLEKLNLNELE